MINLHKLFFQELVLFWKTKILPVLLVIILGLTAYGFISSYQYLGKTIEELDAVKSDIAQMQLETDEILEIDISELEEYVISALSTFHPNNGYKYALAILATIGPILFGIAGALFIGTEYSNQTVKVKVSHFGLSNAVFAKILVLLASMVVTIALVFIAGLFASQIGWGFITSQEAYSAFISEADFNLNYRMLLTPLTGIAFYTFLAFFIALISKKSTAGVIGVFVIPFAEQLLSLSFIPQKLHLYLLNTTYQYFAGWIVSPSMLTTHVKNPTVGYYIFIVWLSVMVGASYAVSKVQRN